LDALEGSAQQTMGDAQGVLAVARALLDQLQDGVTIEIVKTGEASLMDFAMGKADTLPICLRLKP
jgi:hypothetical protein